VRDRAAVVAAQEAQVGLRDLLDQVTTAASLGQHIGLDLDQAADVFDQLFGVVGLGLRGASCKVIHVFLRASASFVSAPRTDADITPHPGSTKSGPGVGRTLRQVPRGPSKLLPPSWR